MFWFDIPNTLFRQLLTLVCASLKKFDIRFLPTPTAAKDADFPRAVAAVRVSSAQQSHDSGGRWLNRTQIWLRRGSIYTCTWCLVKSSPWLRAVIGSVGGRDSEAHLLRTQVTLVHCHQQHLDSESCCTVTCWGVVSFHASPPPDGQQVPRRPLDTVCMRRAKCPPAAWQAVQSSASATSTDT